MKIAVSSDGKTLEDDVSDVFGRCKYFIIVEVKDKKIVKTDVIKNTSAQQMGGAGISAAQLVANKDVKIVIVESIGPRAMEVFNQFDILVYKKSGKIKDILNYIIKAELDKAKK